MDIHCNKCFLFILEEIKLCLRKALLLLPSPVIQLFSAWLGVVFGSSWILFGAVFNNTYQTISKDLVNSEFIGKNFLVTS
jgi:hypothetical protein